VDRLFLDANVLFSAAYTANSSILKLWSLGDIRLCTSHYALEEARRNLHDERHLSRLRKLAASLHMFDAPVGGLTGKIQLPQKDVPIFLAAVEAKASHLITGDLKHFGAYRGKSIAGIVILAPGDYLLLRSNRKG
jgi:predicted nucleic acid-binding protein